MKTKTIEIEHWTINVDVERIIVIDKDIILLYQEFLSNEWLSTMIETEGNYWGIRNLRIPSPVIRIDAAPLLSSSCSNSKEEIKNGIYEVDARPAGIGVFFLIYDKNRKEKKWKKWKEVFENVNCQGIINIGTSIQDDRIMAQILQLPFYPSLPSKLAPPYWVRTNLREGLLVKDLEKISLVPISDDGNKAYLLRLGLAKVLTKEPDWEKPFVIKPLIGTRCEGVKIYNPNAKKVNGVYTRSQILREINNRTSMLIIQDFIPPLEEEINRRRGWTIWRLFFGWFGEEEKYKYIGGLWNWRPNNMKIHGATDAVFGLILEGR